MTRQEAIRGHRNMWNWLAENPGKTKEDYLKEFDPEVEPGYCLCKCDGQCCKNCPPEWSGKCVIGGLYAKWHIASTKFHGNFKGGLLEHSANVALALLDFESEGFTHFEKERSPVVVGLFHDICKVGTYENDSGVYQKKTDDIWQGHATKSLALFSTDMFGDFKLTEQEALCIRYHMGAYEKDDWAAYGQAIQKYPEVLFTHTADMYATHVLGV